MTSLPDTRDTNLLIFHVQVINIHDTIGLNHTIALVVEEGLPAEKLSCTLWYTAVSNSTELQKKRSRETSKIIHFQRGEQNESLQFQKVRVKTSKKAVVIS